MYRLQQITIAVTNMQPMVNFYNRVFEAGLKQINNMGMYGGTLAGFDLLMCPNEIAEVEAKQNRKQLTFIVDDITAVERRVLDSGRSVVNSDGDRIGVSDPDGNTIEFAQSA